MFNILDEWRSKVAYLPQEVFLIDDTLRQNIVLEGNKKLIDEYAGSIKVHLNQNTSNLGRTGNWSCLLDIAESHKIEFVKFLTKN